MATKMRNPLKDKAFIPLVVGVAIFVIVTVVGYFIWKAKHGG